MEPSSPYRPRVSRETRLLLTTGVIALAVLWLLSRIRFEDRPVGPNPVPAVLSQLGSRPRFDELASDLAQLQATLDPFLVTFESPVQPDRPASPMAIGVRWRDDLAIGWLPGTAIAADAASVRARDRASGLTVFRAHTDAAVVPITPWVVRRLEQPRFFVAAEPGADRPALRPVFVGGLVPVQTPLWPDAGWSARGSDPLVPGTLLFTSNAELVGLVARFDGETLIVPAVTLLEQASRLADRVAGEPGTIGTDVSALTAALSSITGAPGGVVVTWVEPAGPAGAHLRVGDVIEAVDGRPIASRLQWDVWSARLQAGDSVTLRVRRAGELHEATVAAAPIVPAPPFERALGLGLRVRRGVGAEVVSVEPGSAAERAGIVAGDVITLFAGVAAPTPAQVARAFGALAAGGGGLVAFTRGDTHHVVAVER